MIILGIFFLFLHKTYIVGTHWKCLTKVLLMSTHNVCFYGELKKIISESQNQHQNSFLTSLLLRFI